MAILISAHELGKSFGARTLFEGLTFTIESKERIGLIGPNGAGKSTLLKILAAQEHPDRGKLSIQKGLKIGFLSQTPEFKAGVNLLSAVMDGVSENLEDWEKTALAEDCLEKLALSSAGLSESTQVETLSGGWKKRVALARELARKPDLFLLDEPTNHLDIESILWLEKFLTQAPFAILVITHDRAFLQSISKRIIELDRRNPNGLLSVRGPYTEYLQLKDHLLQTQKQDEIKLKNTLRRETEWLQRGAKARTTKQQARIHRAEDLKEEVSQLEIRNLNRIAQIDFQSSSKSPKKLLEAKGISKSYSGKKLFENFDLILSPGTRLGLLGKNGAGKSSLIRILLGEDEPDQGDVFRSDQIKLAYFQQNRDALDPGKSVLKTLCPTGDQVIYRGRPVHIRSYLDKFLFSSGQMDMAVGKLSGGEQSRVLIAQLMLQEANLLVLDEPTNDLDLATLNVLEECLSEFQGAIILVTHDRYFLDQVANQILAFDPIHCRIEKFSNLSQWEQWVLDSQEEGEPGKKPQLRAIQGIKKKKLSFNEKKELETIEQSILEAESDLNKWTEESMKAENISQASRLIEITRFLDEAQKKVDELYKRWAKLSEELG